MKMLIKLSDPVIFRGEDQKLRAAIVVELKNNEPEAWVEEGESVALVTLDRYGQHHQSATLSTDLTPGTFSPQDTSVSRG
jgi:hypothetical protein